MIASSGLATLMPRRRTIAMTTKISTRAPMPIAVDRASLERAEGMAPVWPSDGSNTRIRPLRAAGQNEPMTRRGLILFASLGIIWGVPYLFIKIAIAELTPEFLVLARTAVAAALLLPIAARRGAIRPVLRRWRPLLAFTLFEIVLAWYFINAAEQTLPSSTVGLLLASIPLVSIVVAFVMGRRDRLTAVNGVGVVLGMLGVA